MIAIPDPASDDGDAEPALPTPSEFAALLARVEGLEKALEDIARQLDPPKGEDGGGDGGGNGGGGDGT